MKKTNKRAFTIIELVIVIAVIALLAGVLIPTFASLIKKANTSKDTQLIRNLNTALAVDKASGKTHNAMQDALDAAKEAGYDVSRINASNTDNEILWDSVNDVFCYLEGVEVSYIPETQITIVKLLKDDYRLWKIYSADEADKVVKGDNSEKYSAYLTGDGWSSSITADGKGLDVGEVEGVTTVNYESDSSNKVVIRTNSYATLLEVNAPNGAIEHFDKASKVNVIDVAMQSYHEYGNILGNIELTKGNVVVEANSKASAVVINMTAGEVAQCELIKANNEANKEVPIILKASKEAWEEYVNKTNIDPTKNNIIYTQEAVKDENGNVVRDDSGNITVNNYIATIGGIGYSSLDAAFQEVNDSETIILLSDVITNHSLSLSKNFILDLNGYTVTRDNYSSSDKNLFNFSCKVDIIIKNGTLKRNTTSGGDSGAIAVVAYSSKFSLINITIIGYTPNGYLINSNGMQTNADAIIEATNCNFIMYYGNNSTQVCGTAIYLPAGNLVLNDCNMLAPNCLVVCGGSAKINGGTFVATSAHTAYQNTNYTSNSACEQFLVNNRPHSNSGAWAFGDVIQIQLFRKSFNLSSVQISNIMTICLGNGEWGTYGVRVLNLDASIPDAANQLLISSITYCKSNKLSYEYDESKSFVENISNLNISILENNYSCGGFIDHNNYVTQW